MFHFYFLQYCSTAAVWNWMLMEIVEKRGDCFPLLDQEGEGGCVCSNIWIWQNMVKYTFTWSVFCLTWQFMHDIRVICGQPIIIHIGWQLASKMAEEYNFGCEGVSSEVIFNAWHHFWPMANQHLGKILNLFFFGIRNKTPDSSSLRSLTCVLFLLLCQWWVLSLSLASLSCNLLPGRRLSPHWPPARLLKAFPSLLLLESFSSTNTPTVIQHSPAAPNWVSA